MHCNQTEISINRRHSKLDLESSTSAVAQQPQPALKILNQVQDDLSITKRNGFTLIELLVVVLIIGILAAVAVPQYQKAVVKSQFTQVKLTAHDLAKAQEIYYLANGTYTTKLEELDVEAPGTPSGNSRTIIGHVASCELRTTEVICWLHDFDAGRFMYQIFYLHTNDEDAGKRKCVAYPDSNSISYQLCKADTGLSEPDAPPTAYTYWTYQ